VKIKEVERPNHVHQEKSQRFLNMVTPDPTSAVTESIRFELVPHPPYSLDVAPSHLWFLQLSRNISKEFISHVMKIWLQEQPEELYIRSSRNSFGAGKIALLLGQMRYSNKVHLLSYILYFVSFPYLVWM
jgi:hypothetical protein